MHLDPERRVEPVLDQIVPALSGQQVPDLDETHGVIGIAEQRNAVGIGAQQQQGGGQGEAREQHAPVD